MPLFLKKQINTDVLLGVWEITEHIEDLLNNVNLSKKELVLFKNFKNDIRKKQWLCYRLVIKELMYPLTDLEIYYDEYGKPLFLKHNFNLSVSHSGKYAAAIISKTHSVGIDIEKIQPRIERITNKFLNENEINSLEHYYKLENMYVYWCSKEALFKIFSKGNIDFKNNLFIEPFHYEPKSNFNFKQGTLTGKICTKYFSKEYILHYGKIKNYMLVYVVSSKV